MKKFFLFSLLTYFLSCEVCFSQKIIISGKQTDRKLAWSDFTGNVDLNSAFYAYTYYTIRYRFDDIRVFGESVTIGKFEVVVELDPNRTWAKTDKVSDELLLHEQGHFDIGILCMREILAIYNRTSFSRSNFSSEIQSIVNDALKKYNEMGVQYDQETEHCRNKDQQKKWNSLLAEKLRLGLKD